MTHTCYLQLDVRGSLKYHVINSPDYLNAGLAMTKINPLWWLKLAIDTTAKQSQNSSYRGRRRKQATLFEPRVL